MAPYDWANGGSVDIFLHIMSMILLKGSWCYSREWLWNLSAKLLYFFREVKSKQCFTTGVWYQVYKVLGLTIWSACQKYTSLAYYCSTSECPTKWDAIKAGRDKLCENLNPLQGLKFDGTTLWNKELGTCWSRAENGC